jgi:hypothetical protein
LMSLPVLLPPPPPLLLLLLAALLVSDPSDTTRFSFPGSVTLRAYVNEAATTRTSANTYPPHATQASDVGLSLK